MILAALLLQIQQTVRVVAPPNHPYVVQATVPMQQDGLTLQLDDYSSDSRVIAHARGWVLYEICALVDAGDGSLLVRPGTPAPAGALSALSRAARTPDVVSLDLADDVGTLRVSLTGQPVQSWHRRGNVMRTSAHHLDLGRFGWAHLWITMRAATQQLDFILELHNGIPGPDRALSRAKIVTAYPWRPELPDPACAPPYLVKPGRYVIPQQFGRPFRFSVGLTAEPPHVGVADWSRGGFLPPAWPVPAQAAAAYPLAAARAALAATAPWPSWASTPSGPLWPASGVTQGDEGGGQDKTPLLGVRWAASGDPGALEGYEIEQLRSQARARRRYGSDGLPLELPAVAAWSFYDGFLAGRDAPWEWDRWPSGWTPPKKFAPTGIGTLVRELNDNLALAWLANDPLARLYVLESATRARLTFPDLSLTGAPGLGTQWHGAHAMAGLAVIAARALGATEHDAWLAAWAAHLGDSQMPSGVFEAHLGGYPSQNEPFRDRFLLASGGDQADFMLGLYELGGHDDVVRRAARAVWLGTDDDEPGWYYFFQVGPADGSATRYLTDDDWPAGVHAEMGVDGTSGYYTSWSMGYAVACAESVGAVEALALRQRFLFGADPTTWGLEAPDAQTRAPIENWFPVIQ